MEVSSTLDRLQQLSVLTQGQLNAALRVQISNSWLAGLAVLPSSVSEVTYLGSWPWCGWTSEEGVNLLALGVD